MFSFTAQVPKRNFFNQCIPIDYDARRPPLSRRKLALSLKSRKLTCLCLLLNTLLKKPYAFCAHRGGIFSRPHIPYEKIDFWSKHGLRHRKIAGLPKKWSHATFVVKREALVNRTNRNFH